MAQHGTCQLCLQTAELSNSHIVPRYVRVWMVKTSGAIRNFQTPNMPAQDIYKEHLLCQTCENLFSRRENEFKQKVFDPYHEGNTTEFQYEEWLRYFTASILWRVALSRINMIIPQQSQAEHLLEEHLLKDWRDYLLGNTAKPNYTQEHIFFTENLDTIFHEQIEENQNVYSYFKRTLHVGTVSDGNSLLVFAKLPGILLVSNVGAAEDGWEGTKVNEQGILLRGQQSIGEVSKGVFSAFVKKFSEFKEEVELSERTKQRLNERYQKMSIDELLKDEDFVAMLKDFDIPIELD